MWHGGNQWSGWNAFLSFFRHIAKMELPIYEKYRHWESAGIHGGPRIMHADFCMISDRPELLIVDDLNMPHCETGPFCRWRDGSSLYAIHGVYVPQWVVEHPERISVERIHAQPNEEVRRIMIERFGWERYLREYRASVINQRFNERDQQRETLYGLPDGTKRIIVSDPSTGRKYALGIPREIDTCEEAQNWMSHGLDSQAIHRS